MNLSRRHVSRNLSLGALLAGGIMACGQRGPLVLPEEARPIERIEVPQPPPQPQPQAPESQGDEQKKNER
jgi:predicted small lipoprotein YifL